MRGDEKYMKSEMKKCIELKITKDEKVYIELRAPYEDIILKMLPASEVVDSVPNIWYESFGNKVSFFCDMESLYCDKNANIFDIMFVIEDYIKARYNFLFLHGAALACNEQSLAFIQSRKSGKSTLIRALLNDMKYEYISDDLLLYKNKEIAGVALPIRVRNKLENIVESNGQYIGKMQDEIGEIRNIYVPANQIRTGFTKITAIILPQYVQWECNEIKEIKGAQKVTRILNNIKEYQDMKNLYSEVVEIAQTIPLYELQYHDIDFAKKELDKLWNR